MLHQTHDRPGETVDKPAKHAPTWIVVAAYNEQQRLGETLAELTRLYEHVVVVDDGSRDATYRVAGQYPVWVLRHMVNCGQGAALQTGIDFALANGAEAIVTFDADGQHSAAEIARVAEPVLSGRADVALGSRFLGTSTGMPWSRRVVLKLGVLFTRVVSRVKVSDAHNGLRCLSRRAAMQLRITENRMAHASELLEQIRRYDLPYCEVPVTIHYTAATLRKGQSSWSSLSIAAQFLLGKMVQ